MLTFLVIFVVVTIFFSLLVFLFYHYFFLKEYVFRKKNKFDIKLKYLDFVLGEQDKKYIDRLENISKINTSFEGVFISKNDKLKSLISISENIKNEINEVWNKKIINKNYKGIKKDFYFFKKKIKKFEIDVIDFNDDLVQIFKPEESYKIFFLEIKKKFNMIKEFYKNNNKLRFLEKSYDCVFKDIGVFFTEFSKNIECANYNEVSNILTQLDKIINELEKINVEMPKLCSVVFETISNKISFLENEFKNMISKKYNVKFLLNDDYLLNLKKKYSDLILDLKKFNYKKVSKESELIVNEIDNLLLSLSKEKEARDKFEKEINDIFLYENNVEKKIIKFFNFFSKIKKIYVVPKNKEDEFNEIRIFFDKEIIFLKRLLDNSICNTESKIYSVLFSKMVIFKEKVQKIEKKIDDFFNYLNSFKNNIEDIYDNILNFYYSLRKAEKIIRDVNIDAFTNKYFNKVKNIYDRVENIYSFLNKIPINIEKINDLFNTYLKCEADSIINMINKDFNMMKLIEKKIIILNQNRSLDKVNDIVKQSEFFFYKADFEKSFNIIADFENGDLKK